MSAQPAPEVAARAICRSAGRSLGGELEPHRVALGELLDRLADRVVLFRHGDWVFVSFGLFGALGAVLTTALMGAILVGQGVAPGLFLSMALLGSGAVVGGSWLLAQAFDYRLLLDSPREALCRPVFISWGGVLGLLLTLALFASLSGQSLPVLLDALARSIFLGHYEAVLELALLVGINAVALYGAPVGAPTALAFVGYGCIRFAVEFSRDQQGRTVIGSLSVNHLVALATLGLGAGLAALTLPGGLGLAPAVTWSASLAAAHWLAPASLPGALVIFVGFSLHRRGIGRW
jgi:hypothetical protein